MTESTPHWNFFLAIESDLASCARYVDFCDANMVCSSVEFSKIVMLACAEIENATTSLVQLDGGKWKALHQRFPRLQQVLIQIPRYGIQRMSWVLKPDPNKSGKQQPDFWTAYVDRKHSEFRNATLGNAIDAVGGLLAVLHLRYVSLIPKPEFGFDMAPRLFTLSHPPSEVHDGWTSGGIFWGWSDVAERLAKEN